MEDAAHLDVGWVYPIQDGREICPWEWTRKDVGYMVQYHPQTVAEFDLGVGTCPGDLDRMGVEILVWMAAVQLLVVLLFPHFGEIRKHQQRIKK